MASRALLCGNSKCLRGTVLAAATDLGQRTLAGQASVEEFVKKHHLVSLHSEALYDHLKCGRANGLMR